MSGYLRFRRVLPLVGNCRVNIGKAGASLSCGPRGGPTVTAHSSGAMRASVSAPGTGLGYTWYLPPPARRRHAQRMRYRWPRTWLVWQLLELGVLLVCALGVWLLHTGAL